MNKRKLYSVILNKSEKNIIPLQARFETKEQADAFKKRFESKGFLVSSFEARVKKQRKI